ncbi:MAG: hypothetical protein ABSD72_06790 [Terracidiphilus sp.]|jgi:hypothetical protein
MNHYIMIRRLRGPAILLLIGGVWLLHSTGVIDRPCHWFWPLLLILLGVLMLAERMVLAGGGGYPQPPYPGQPGTGTIDPQSTTSVPPQPEQPEAHRSTSWQDPGNHPEGGQS